MLGGLLAECSEQRASLPRRQRPFSSEILRSGRSCAPCFLSAVEWVKEGTPLHLWASLLASGRPLWLWHHFREGIFWNKAANGHGDINNFTSSVSLSTLWCQPHKTLVFPVLQEVVFIEANALEEPCVQNGFRKGCITHSKCLIAVAPRWRGPASGHRRSHCS